MLITSKLTRTEFSGKLQSFKLSIMSNICLVSLILDGILSAFLYKTYFTNIDRISTTVLQALVIVLTGLLTLWINNITRLYILLVLGESHEMKDFHELSITFLTYHFSIQLLNFCWNSLLGSSFSSLKELLSICCWTFSSKTSFSSMTNLVLFPFSLTSLSSYDLISFKALFSSLLRLIFAILTFSRLNSSFSIFSMNVPKLLYLVSLVRYNGEIFDSGF